MGDDFSAAGTGPTGSGLLPILSTPANVVVDPATGFTPASQTNMKLKVVYQTQASINRRRPGFPNDLRISFSDVPVDTPIAMAGYSKGPVYFHIEALNDDGTTRRLKCRFYENRIGADNKLNKADEFIDVITYLPEKPSTNQITWRISVDTTGQYLRGPIQGPKGGDVWNLVLQYPLGEGDMFSFTTREQYIDPNKARTEFVQDPYVVPNPYVGAASFEAARFAISGRGERRIEFRSLPADCDIRIYSVRGELVQTLHHDGGDQGFVAWDLRSKDNLDVAPGLYIFHVDAKGQLGSKIGKFAIIK